MGAHTGSHRNSSTSATRRTRPPASSPVAPIRRPLATKPTNKAMDGKARTRRRDMEVWRKMEALRRLVPSSDDDGDGDGEVDELLLRAAGYIARLQAQVTVMQLMVHVLEHRED